MKRLASVGVDVVSCVSVNHDSRCDVSEWPVILAKPIDGPERARGFCGERALTPFSVHLRRPHPVACISRIWRVQDCNAWVVACD